MCPQRDGIDWSTRDLRYLLRDEYEKRFRRWLAEATTVRTVDAARHAATSSSAGDLRVYYYDKTQLVSMCKSLGLMEDLKAGVPRTAYHGVVMVRMNGRRVFLAPSYTVDQDITDTSGRSALAWALARGT